MFSQQRCKNSLFTRKLFFITVIFSVVSFVYNLSLAEFTYTKLAGVGPVDNRPSTDKLHQFVKKKNVTCDT